jgi:uncharacterized protein YjbI with pentapeptide repeats
LFGTYLQGAWLDSADLRGAWLARAVLEGATLTRADLSGAQLDLAALGDVRLQGARLTGADLRGAWLAGLGSSPRGVDFRGALYDRTTRWPVGFDPRRHGAVLTALPAAGGTR